MGVKIALLVLVLALAGAVHATALYNPLDRSSAISSHLYRGVLGRDFFCDCELNLRWKTVEEDSCHLTEPSTFKDTLIVPREYFKRTGLLSDCNDKPCVLPRTGQEVSGDYCCRGQVEAYRDFISSPFNVITVLQDVELTIPGTVETVTSESCNIKFGVDKNGVEVYEPADVVKGDLARTFTHVAAEANIALTAEEKELFAAWQATDPLNFYECQVAAAINTMYKDVAFFKYKKECADILQEHRQYYRSTDEL